MSALEDGPLRRLLRKQFMQRKDEYGRPIVRGRGIPCPVCGRYKFDEFWVSDEDWAKYVPKQYQNTMICKPCYEEFKRERLRGERLLPRFLPQGVRGIDSGLEAMKEAKRREWSSRGYSPGLIDKATRLADEWAFSMARTWSPPGRPDVYEAILRTSYPKALDAAQKWIDVMSAQRY